MKKLTIHNQIITQTYSLHNSLQKLKKTNRKSFLNEEISNTKISFFGFTQR